MTTRYVQVGQCTTDTDTVHTVSHQRYIHDSTGGEAPSLLHWWDPFTTPLAVTTPLAGPHSLLHWRDPLHDSTGRTPLGNRQQNARPPPLSKISANPFSSFRGDTYQTDRQQTHTHTLTHPPHTPLYALLKVTS